MPKCGFLPPCSLLTLFPPLGEWRDGTRSPVFGLSVAEMFRGMTVRIRVYFLLLTWMRKVVWSVVLRQEALCGRYTEPAHTAFASLSSTLLQDSSFVARVTDKMLIRFPNLCSFPFFQIFALSLWDSVIFVYMTA